MKGKSMPALWHSILYLMGLVALLYSMGCFSALGEIMAIRFQAWFKPY